MKLVKIVCALLLPFASFAQVTIGFGPSYKHFDGPFISDRTGHGTIGWYVLRTGRFETGLNLTLQNHDYGTMRRLPYLTERSYVTQTGVLSSVFAGYRVDGHLSVGVLAGYEWLAKDRQVKIHPFGTMEYFERRFESGRPAAGVYAAVHFFKETRLSPVVVTSYTILPEAHNRLCNLSTSVCLHWDYKK